MYIQPSSITTIVDSVSYTHLNERSLQLQKYAEQMDPNFSVSRDWYKKTKHVVQPVEQGFETGIGWESYKVFEELNEKCQKTEDKVETLTEMISELTALIKELKIKQD